MNRITKSYFNMMLSLYLTVQVPFSLLCFRLEPVKEMGSIFLFHIISTLNYERDLIK